MGTEKLKRAFSLMENIVSLVIISIMVTGFIATFFWSQARNFIAERQLQALDFAKETVGELYLKDYTAPELSVGDHNATTDTFLELPSCTLKDNFSASRSYTVTRAPEDKMVTVTVNWQEVGEQKFEQLYALIIQK